MTPQEAALEAIKRRSVYSAKAKGFVFVNRLIYWSEELMLIGYVEGFRVDEYGKTWALTEEELE